MRDLILRWTVWQTEGGDHLQVSLCVMDATWEPLMERTLPCGPFHELEERRLELLEDLRRWMRSTGYQAELPL